MQREAYEMMKARQDQEHVELDKQLVDAALQERAQGQESFQKLRAKLFINSWE